MNIRTKFNPGDPIQFQRNGKLCISRVKMIHLSVYPDQVTGTTNVLPAENTSYSQVVYYEVGYLDRPPKDQIVICEDECCLAEVEA